METSNHGAGGGYHVLQQNRREKLRNQRSNITQSQQHYSPNFDLPQLPDWQYTNIPSDSSSVLSSEMLNFAPNSHPPFFHPHKHIEDDPVAIQESTSNSPRFDKQKIGSVWIDSSNLAPMFGYQELGQYHQNTLQEVVTSAANPTQPWLAANDHFVVNNTQALSLSLSSVSPPKTAYLGHNIGERPGNLTFSHRDLVPLGPFTGYATILKSSRFLKPAQQLLDEFCNFPGHKALSIISEASGDNMLDDEAPNSTFYTSSERSSNESSSHQPEYLQNKVKLLYMQDEVCRRYRQYHQQMQMVVSSFESVAGLSAATPYISLALKAVLCQFRCFKNAISDQLAHIRKELGEATPSPCIKRDNTGGRPSTLQNQNPGGQRLHYLEPQPHVWRPQRGLPERAVAVLRAWLFDHFLHPYPTDTDKHMLAAQTGLTRNQVSNWFINARVRVWKPMVEEIHVLETKTMGEKGSKTGTQNGSQPSEQGQHLNVPEEECPPVNTWNQEKRLRIDCGLPAVSMGNDNDTRQLVAAGGFMPYHQRNSLEMGSGLGAVSLTLGLRQSVVDGGQQHQHDQSQFIRQRFGGQIIHDLAG